MDKARNSSAQAVPPGGHFDGLRAIALFKFGKVILLIASTYGLRQLLHPDIIARLNDWIVSLTDGFMRQVLNRALAWVNAMGTARLNLVIAISVGYMVLVTLEGIGLWFRRVWGEWLTIVATASLIPFELWELVSQRGVHRSGVVLALMFNLSIVGYLVAQLQKNARERALQIR